MSTNAKLTELVADIVAAHVANNTVAVGDVGNLIHQVHSALAGLKKDPSSVPSAKTAIVSIRASVKPDFIVCMECGRKQKTLKRHLQTAHGMTPDQYRQDYGLTNNYPMTAPNYSEQRKALAKTIGLGRKPKTERTGAAHSAKSKRKLSIKTE
ncbi:MAG TPA: MucR family transcriptional regulator [Sphingomicrobium sp.]|jgi:predicted transcriptional regulator